MHNHEKGAVLITSLTMLFSLAFSGAWYVQAHLQQLKSTNTERYQHIAREIEVSHDLRSSIAHWQKTGDTSNIDYPHSQAAFTEHENAIELIVRHQQGETVRRQLRAYPLFTNMPQHAWISMNGQEENWRDVLHLSTPALLKQQVIMPHADCSQPSTWYGIVVIEDDCYLPANAVIGKYDNPLVLVVLGKNTQLASRTLFYGVLILAAKNHHFTIAKDAQILGTLLSLEPLANVPTNIIFNTEVLQRVQASPQIVVRKAMEGTWRDF